MIDKTAHIILFFVIAAAAFVFLKEAPEPSQGQRGGENSCSESLTYRAGEIDPRFNLQTHELLEIMKDVETLWSVSEGQKLLEHQENGRVAINLIYDERQQLVDQEKELARRIENGKMKYDRLAEEYGRLKSEYDRQLQSLENEVESINKILENEFEIGDPVKSDSSTVSGSAKRRTPTSKDMQEKIEDMKRSVNQKATDLEQTRQRVNREADRLNEMMERNRELIDDYNERFSKGYRFHQGEYSRDGDFRTINIYKFEDRDDLKLILAHEAGHALGLPHVENPESVMYYTMRHQDRTDLVLTEQDRAALRNMCGK